MNTTTEPKAYIVLLPPITALALFMPDPNQPELELE